MRAADKVTDAMERAFVIICKSLKLLGLKRKRADWVPEDGETIQAKLFVAEGVGCPL